MDTGGTRDIIVPGRTGLLSRDAASLGDDLARLVADRELAAELGRAARAHVDRFFSAAGVVARIEDLYRDAVAGCA
jgi:glycosyltransferase involved in cell wall biosynthesis